MKNQYEIDYQQGYDTANDEWLERIDKIRAEIEENINYNKKMNYQGIVTGLLLALAIIDKYKAETEAVDE